MAQGFFYTRALPAAALERWLDDHAFGAATHVPVLPEVPHDMFGGRVAP